jgi:hypothetical protein
MSQQVITYMSKKENGGYSTFIPFGVVSNNVKMQNLNTLEEEFKLGGNCITTITESEQDDIATTHIIEEYKDAETTSDYYKVITDIVENGDTTTITQSMYMVSADEESLIKSKTISFEETDNETIITEEIK